MLTTTPGTAPQDASLAWLAEAGVSLDDVQYLRKVVAIRGPRLESPCPRTKRILASYYGQMAQQANRPATQPALVTTDAKHNAANAGSFAISMA